MEYSIVVFVCNARSVGGTYIDRKVVEEYLRSEEYEIANRDRLMLGGLTHIDREVGDDSDIIGRDDKGLLHRNITHYIKDLYLNSGDELIATLVPLDPKNFTGKAKDNIEYLIGLLSSGIKLTGSVVIDGDWVTSRDGKGEDLRTIYKLAGWDITLNPDYEDSRFIH